MKKEKKEIVHTSKRNKQNGKKKKTGSQELNAGIPYMRHEEDKS